MKDRDLFDDASIHDGTKLREVLTDRRRLACLGLMNLLLLHLLLQLIQLGLLTRELCEETDSFLGRRFSESDVDGGATTSAANIRGTDAPPRRRRGGRKNASVKMSVEVLPGAA